MYINEKHYTYIYILTITFHHKSRSNNQSTFYYIISKCAVFSSETVLATEHKFSTVIIPANWIVTHNKHMW